jgi:hypothetical protein
MNELRKLEIEEVQSVLLNGTKPEGEQYELAKSTIAKWPDWKKDIFNRLIQITT